MMQGGASNRDLLPPTENDLTALRRDRICRALRFEYLTVGWNLIEGVVAIAAAVGAGSIALLGFGIDSFVESASATILIWRLRAERGGPNSVAVEALDRRAHRLVAISLFLLALFIAFDAVRTLWQGERPRPTVLGVALLIVSIAVMVWLARAKRHLATELGSRALAADAFQTTACWWLSIFALSGIGLNALLGWWWADPLAALIMAGLIVREGREAWRGDVCC